MRRLLLVFALLGTALAQRQPLALKDYYQIESVSEPALSPDARQVAFTRTHIQEAENKRVSEIWLSPADGSTAPKRLSDPTVSATNPRFSADGKLLAYTAAGQWFVRVGASDQAPFHISGVAGTPVFSPDNQWIAFLKKVPPLLKRAPELSEFERITQERFKGRIYDWMNFRFDGRGYLPDPRSESATPPMELFIVPLAGGDAKQLTHMGVDVLTPAWSSDSRMLAFTANTHQRDENSYERADLWTVTLEGEPKRLTADDGWHHRSPAWSPNGQFLAVLREEGLDRVLKSKRTQAAPLDLYLIPAAGGTPRNLTANWDDLPGPPKWSTDGQHIFFHAGIKGTAHLFRATLSADPKIEQVTQGDRVLGEASVVGDRIAYTATSPDQPVELYSALLPKGAKQASGEKKLTAIQDSLLARWQLGNTERIRYDSKDGTSIDGWVGLPPGYDAAKTYPLILSIHGGPHGAFSSSFSFEEQLFAAAGNIVVYTNPRGSTGYGEKFEWGTWGAWGDKDLEDVMSGVDYAIKHYQVDPKRLGITGYSYGGFLTNWAIGHTDRFAAAVVGAGPSDWISNYGTGDIPRTKESEFLGHPWDAEANAVMIRQSPITYARNIHTPTLFVHGEADARVPISQAEEMYTTLKKQGIPAKFIRYPGEYHGGWSPWDTVHRFGQELSWWQQYLANGGAGPEKRSAK
jgi:dipeptidyl aminopeptidase/acylaminoacyl peptidase